MNAQEETFTVRVVCHRRYDNSETRVLMVHNRRRDPKPAGWGLPGGRVKMGESLQKAAIRELREEAGLEVSPGFLVERGRSLARGSETHWNVFFGIVDYKSSMGEITAGEDPDVDKVKWASSIEILEEYSSVRNGGVISPLGEDDYYPSHLAVACGVFPT